MRFFARFAASIAIVAAATSAQAGCMRCDPILNVSNAPVAAGKDLTADQVKGAIVRAGVALGWTVREEAAGKLVANIALRKHTATLEIPYSAKEYSLVYKDSTNLDATGDGTIHKNYNGWVSNFNKGIAQQLQLSASM
jgi:hypothetical protein